MFQHLVLVQKWQNGWPQNYGNTTKSLDSPGYPHSFNVSICLTSGLVHSGTRAAARGGWAGTWSFPVLGIRDHGFPRNATKTEVIIDFRGAVGSQLAVLAIFFPKQAAV